MKEAVEKNLLREGMRVRSNGDCGGTGPTYTGVIVDLKAYSSIHVCRDDWHPDHIGGGVYCPRHPETRKLAWQTNHANDEAFIEILKPAPPSPFDNARG